MKRFISIMLLVVMLFTTAVCTTSCGNEDDGAEISVYLNDRVYSFDPAGDYTDDATISVMHLLYEPLFVLDDDGDVVEAAAEEYTFDKETGDLIITLRESYWTSGDRVTAEDFIYAWRRIISPDASFTAAPLLYDIKNAVAVKTAVSGVKIDDFGAVALSNSVLRISFQSEDVDRDQFLRNLASIALAPIQRTCVQGQGEFWSSAASGTCYTNGPFKIKDLDNAAGYFTLIRHTDYHRPEDSKKSEDHYVVPKMLRTIWNMENELTEAQHSEEMYKLMESKAEDTVFYMSALSLEDRKEVAETAEVSDNLSTYTYVFDNSNPLFQDAAVRTVLSQVIDRNEIVELVTFGKAATGFISHGVWNATSSREKKSFRSIGGELISTSAVLSIQEAQNKLAELNAKIGSFTLTFMDREEDLAIASYVKSIWEQLGYTVELEPVNYYVVQQDTGGKDSSGNSVVTEYHVPALQRILNGSTNTKTGEKYTFDVIAIDYQMFSTNAFAALASLSSNLSGAGVDMGAYNASTDADKVISQFALSNIANYKNDAYDQLIALALETADLLDRAVILHQAEEILLEDMPVIPLMFNQSFYVAHKNMSKLDVNYWGFTVFTRAKLKNYEDYLLSK